MVMVMWVIVLTPVVMVAEVVVLVVGDGDIGKVDCGSGWWCSWLQWMTVLVVVVMRCGGCSDDNGSVVYGTVW